MADLTAGLESDRAALLQFDAAIAADPVYAAARARHALQLAAIANATSEASEISRLLEESISAACQSIELEPMLALGHLALGYAPNYGQFDRKGAEPHYRRAQEVDPGNADVIRNVAWFDAYGKNPGGSLTLIDGVLDLDPLNANAFRSAGFAALFARDYSKGITYCRQALDLNPGIASVYYVIGCARLMQGDLPGALQAFETEDAIVRPFGQLGRAIAHERMGNKDEAKAA